MKYVGWTTCLIALIYFFSEVACFFNERSIMAGRIVRININEDHYGRVYKVYVQATDHVFLPNYSREVIVDPDSDFKFGDEVYLEKHEVFPRFLIKKVKKEEDLP